MYYGVDVCGSYRHILRQFEFNRNCMTLYLFFFFCYSIYYFYDGFWNEYKTFNSNKWKQLTYNTHTHTRTKRQSKYELLFGKRVEKRKRENNQRKRKHQKDVILGVNPIIRNGPIEIRNVKNIMDVWHVRIFCGLFMFSFEQLKYLKLVLNLEHWTHSMKHFQFYLWFF